MIELIQIYILVVLLIFTVVDLKWKRIHSVYTTAFLLSILILFGQQAILSGIITFVFAWFLVESKFMDGLSEIKLLTSIGMIITFGWQLLAVLVTFMFISLIYKAILSIFFKKESQISLILPILLTYVVIFLIYTIHGNI